MNTLIAVAIIVIVILVIIVSIRNGLIARRNGVEMAKGSLDAMLKKRYDLIPNLIATVQQYSTYEADTLSRITQLRTKGMQGNLTANEQAEVDTQYQALGKNFLALAENYPDLKASENYLELQGSLNETEEQIAAARRTYNAAINSHNNGVEQFPGSMFASGMGMVRKEMPTITTTESQNIDVKKLFNS